MSGSTGGPSSAEECIFADLWVCADAPRIVEQGLCYGCCEQDVELVSLCSRCDDRLCRVCLERLLDSRFEAAKIYGLGVPNLKCHACGAHVPTRAWATFTPQVAERQVAAARSLLNVNCCGKVSLFQEEVAADPAALERKLFSDCAIQVHSCRLRLACARFRIALVTAAEFLDELQAVFVSSGYPGAAEGSLAGMAPAWLADLFAPGGLLSLIGDVERRAELQVAFRRRFSLTRSPCCGSEICFVCNTRGWHDAGHCRRERIKRVGRGAQFCPQCGVATERNGGCSHMACVCGAHWTWADVPVPSFNERFRASPLEAVKDHLEIEGAHAALENGEALLAAVLGMLADGKLDLEVISLILDGGADINAHNRRGKVPLHVAVRAACGAAMLARAKPRRCVRAGADRLRDMAEAKEAVHAWEAVARLLVHRGAEVSRAALEDLSPRERRHCPHGLALALGAWWPAAATAAGLTDVVDELSDAKFAREQARSRARLQAADGQRRREVLERAGFSRSRTKPRGGRHKSGERAVDPCSLAVQADLP